MPFATYASKFVTERDAAQGISSAHAAERSNSRVIFDDCGDGSASTDGDKSPKLWRGERTLQGIGPSILEESDTASNDPQDPFLPEPEATTHERPSARAQRGWFLHMTTASEDLRDTAPRSGKTSTLSRSRRVYDNAFSIYDEEDSDESSIASSAQGAHAVHARRVAPHGTSSLFNSQAIASFGNSVRSTLRLGMGTISSSDTDSVAALSRDNPDQAYSMWRPSAHSLRAPLMPQQAMPFGADLQDEDMQEMALHGSAYDIAEPPDIAAFPAQPITAAHASWAPWNARIPLRKWRDVAFVILYALTLTTTLVLDAMTIAATEVRAAMWTRLTPACG